MSDMSALLQSIPMDAWITPYIVAANLLLADRKLSEKQLTDISFQQVGGAQHGTSQHNIAQRNTTPVTITRCDTLPFSTDSTH